MTDTPKQMTDDDFLSPIDVQTMADQATERLRNAIQRGSLEPGMQLVERELAQKLGMSRVPVREAIQRLAEEGLVKKTAHRGTVVYLPSSQEIEEITSLRIVLEQFVVERVMERWQPEHEVALQSIVDQLRVAVQTQDRQRMSELDSQFHLKLWQVADHGILLEVVSSLRQRVNRFLFETIRLMHPAELTGAVASHEALLAVLASGDIEAAKREISRHISGAKDRIIAYHQRTFAASEHNGSLS